jgi:hypothetical protein
MKTRRECPVPATSAVEVTEEDEGTSSIDWMSTRNRRASAPSRSMSAGRARAWCLPARTRSAGAACIAATSVATRIAAVTIHQPPPAIAAPACTASAHQSAAGSTITAASNLPGAALVSLTNAGPCQPADHEDGGGHGHFPHGDERRNEQDAAVMPRAETASRPAARCAQAAVLWPAGVSAASASTATPQATAAPRARRRVRW